MKTRSTPAARFITTTEAADLKGVTPAAIRRAVAEGRLDGVKSGKFNLIDRRSLERWQPRTKETPYV